MTLPLGSMRQAVVIGGSSAREVDISSGVVLIDPNVVASVTLSPSAFSIIEGLDVQDITATPRNSSGGTVGGTATWTTSDAGIATVVSTGSLSGRVTAIADGTVTITATVDGIGGTSLGTILPAVATVSVAPDPMSVSVLGSVAADAAVLDDQGLALANRNINWLSADAGVASVVGGAAYTATVTGVAVGSAIITATVEGVSGTSTATVSQSSADLFLDFNDGTSNFTLGTSMFRDQTGFGNLPTWPSQWRKHSWVPTGGFDGGGFIRMHWNPGMTIGFSPIFIQAPSGFQPHYEIKYMVRQSATMVHNGSSIKLFRQNGLASGYDNGTMEWGDTSGNYQRLKWFFDSWADHPPDPTDVQTSPCCFDLLVPGEGCSPKVDNLVGTGWHEFKLTLDLRDPAASTFAIEVDGVVIRPPRLYPPNQYTVPPVGSRYDFSPFAEMYSTGDGTSAAINTGNYDVDHFSYTVLP